MCSPPPKELLRSQDVVVSFGLVEHFTDTSRAVAAFARFLAPGGRIITTVPNMAGWIGGLQRLFAPDIFDKHVVLSASALERAHRDAGLHVVASGYLQFLNFGVVNPGTPTSWTKRTVFQGLRAITGAVWAMEEVVRLLPPNRLTSPYAFCVATQPD